MDLPIDGQDTKNRFSTAKRPAWVPYWTKRKRQLGNTPQAFSHVPLVTSALQLTAGRHSRSNSPSLSPPSSATSPALGSAGTRG